MLSPLLLGLIAAVVVAVPAHFASWGNVFGPLLIAMTTLVAMALQHLILNRKPGSPEYSGLSDLFIHIHSVASPDSPMRWFTRACISTLLVLSGGLAGSEGPAIEFCQGLGMKLRERSSQRFEQTRRTDAAVALAAGISAAFSAPFAAILVPMELGAGGRTISTVLAAISAFLGSQFLNQRQFQWSSLLSGFHTVAWNEWFGILLIAVSSAVLSTVVIRFLQFTEKGFARLFDEYGSVKYLLRLFLVGVFLFFAVMFYRPAMFPPGVLLEKLLWSSELSADLGILLFSKILVFSLVIGGFGTLGLFWPTFTIGCVFGISVSQWVLPEISGFQGMAALVGGAAIWGSLLGVPLAGAVLAYELSHSLQILLAALISSYLARTLARFLRAPTFLAGGLRRRGVSLVDGRSKAILDSIPVHDAMVTDFDTAHEYEPVTELQARFLNSKYPFLPVVNTQGLFVGLLMIEMIQNLKEAQKATHPSLEKILEAKDILYRAGLKVPTVNLKDRLSVTAGLFGNLPCIPVLNDEGRVAGLLFVYNVRLAYDREVARRSLAPEEKE